MAESEGIDLSGSWKSRSGDGLKLKGLSSREQLKTQEDRRNHKQIATNRTPQGDGHNIAPASFHFKWFERNERAEDEKEITK
ncbi:uncharacterized protein G2W53_026304 [Senna tora]|uniref:Uncharacterized protein n=1 Tax=Senna tora TaxID=362788 RepID=A0A834WL40_9FABA|nr:uncharacterized protein G2W53_026304 [Senna tora]